MCNKFGLLTKEHYHPKWMRKIFPIRNDATGINFATGEINPNRDVGTKVAKIGDCCNSGWMKQLQDFAIPVITPMVRGDSWGSVSKKDAQIISKWAVMTTISIEETHPQGLHAITLDERVMFSATQEIGENWNIWIGRSSGDYDRGASHRPFTINQLIDGQIDSRTGQSLAAQFGKLILFTWFGHDTGLSDKFLTQWE